MLDGNNARAVTDNEARVKASADRRPELVAELETIGGDVVVGRLSGCPGQDQSGQAELRLALDGVSGPATGVLAATLSPRGTLVSFAAMSESPIWPDRAHIESAVDRCERAAGKPTRSKLVEGPAESEKFVRWKSMKNSEENS
jgi:hypothetical protein